MLKRVSFAVAAASFFAGGATANEQVEPISIEAFSQSPAVTSVSMSLEGDMLVGVIRDPRDGEEMGAAAYWDLSGEIDTSSPLVPDYVTPSSGRTIFTGAAALKNRMSLWFTVQPYIGDIGLCGTEGRSTGSTKKYITPIYLGNENLTDIDEVAPARTRIGGNNMWERCFEIEGVTEIASFLPLDPVNIVIERQTSDEGTRFYKYNLDTGRETFMFSENGTENFELSNRTGERVSNTELVFRGGAWTQQISLYDPTKGELTLEPQLTTTIEDRYTMELVGSDVGTNRYYIATDRFTDKVSVFLYDVTLNQFSDDPVLAHPEFNISGMIFSQREEDFGTPIGFRYSAGVTETYWIDPEMASIQQGLEQAYPGKHVSMNDWTADRNRILFTVSSSSMPPAYFLLVDKQRVATIGSSRPWIDPATLGETELVYYEARDGLRIPALLTLPPGYEEGTPARGAIIHPHGGPWARDYGGFDSSGWVGYFANRGYIILQPQYRGSNGWGRELWLAGDGEWGQKMQDDKDDGAAWLVENGYVAADKIAIHGYSYGGFAAIAASVRPNSPYQCAIAGAGVANLTILGNSWGENRIQRIYQGRTVTGMDPMQHTDEVNIPIMLYHGDYDVRVPIFHSRDFYNAVKNREPQSEFIVLEQMGHQGNKWLPEHKASVLDNMERFLTTTCGM